MATPLPLATGVGAAAVRALNPHALRTLNPHALRALNPPNLRALNAPAPAAGPAKAPTALQNKARAAAQDFEAVFLNSMFTQMFTGIDGDGPFGGGTGTGIWRSFLTEEYSKTFAKAGGVGIADHVYRSLLAQQEAPRSQPR